MSSILGKLAVSIVGQMDDLDKTFKAASKQINKFAKETSALGESVSRMGQNLTAGVTLPIVGLGAAAVKLASDLAEVQNVVDVTFGPNAKDIDTWSKNAMQGFGLTELQAKKMTGTMGAMVKSMGLTDDETLNMSKSLTGLAGDMASFYNLDHQQAFDKIRAGIAGETEPLKALGINMSVANLEAFALAQGINESYKEMTQAEQATLRYNYLMQASADAQGDFARTSDGFANQLRIMQGEMTNLGAEIGQILLPYALQLVQAIRDLVGNFQALDPGIKTAIIAVAGAAAVLGPLLMIIGGLISAVGTIAGAFGAFTASLAATTGPSAAVMAAITGVGATIAVVIASIGLFVAAIVDLWRNNEAFRTNLIKLWAEIQATAQKVFGELKAFWDKWGGDITATFTAVWDLIKTIVSVAVQAVSDVIRVVLAVIRGDWDGAWKAVQTLLSNAWTGIGQILKAGIDAFVLAITTMIVMVKTHFDQMITDALNWGANLMGSFIDGFMSKFRDLQDAVRGAAETVSDFLGFHSPTKKGPGSDADVWGPNLVKTLADGIDSEMARLQSSLGNFALNLNPALSMATPAFAGNTTTNNTPITINVYDGASGLKRELSRLGVRMP